MIAFITLGAWLTFCGGMLCLMVHARHVNPQLLTIAGVASWVVMTPICSVMIYEHFQLAAPEQWVNSMEFIVKFAPTMFGLLCVALSIYRVVTYTNSTPNDDFGHEIYVAGRVSNDGAVMYFAISIIGVILCSVAMHHLLKDWLL